MSSKTRACGAVLALCSVGILAGCSKPGETNKPATQSSSVKAPGPAPANTTDTK